MSSTPSSKDISSIQTDAGIQDRVCIQENTSIPIGQPQDQGDQLADDNDLSTETTLVEKMQMFKNLALRPNAKEKRVKWVDESNIATTPETAGFVTQQGPRETGPTAPKKDTSVCPPEENASTGEVWTGDSFKPPFRYSLP
ncbi:uncharacterized protein LOC113334230 isoform X4 [Papaver somniferum]|uniref:uncharacterized protein LOC113334230 isoform X4 n=1 Tax=Papaver somniferum TaxID=3469 RepID=UPI000E703B5D|nr:uncharacterized protein LOC113334230 isoform X4 [Papaver somniferum]